MIDSGIRKVLSWGVFYLSGLFLVAIAIGWDSYVRSQDPSLGGHDFEQGGMAGFQFSIAIYAVALLVQSVAYVVPLTILTIRSRNLGGRLIQCAIASGIICAASIGLFVSFGLPLHHWGGFTAVVLVIVVPASVILQLMQSLSSPTTLD